MHQNMELLLRLYCSLSELRWRLTREASCSLVGVLEYVGASPSNSRISEAYNSAIACMRSPSCPSHSCTLSATPSPSAPPSAHRITSHTVVFPASKLSFSSIYSRTQRGRPSTRTLELKISGTTNSKQAGPERRSASLNVCSNLPFQCCGWECETVISSTPWATTACTSIFTRQPGSLLRPNPTSCRPSSIFLQSSSTLRCSCSPLVVLRLTQSPSSFTRRQYSRWRWWKSWQEKLGLASSANSGRLSACPLSARSKTSRKQVNCVSLRVRRTTASADCFDISSVLLPSSLGGSTSPPRENNLQQAPIII